MSAATILERLSEWSASQPDKRCYTFCDGKLREQETLTYRELDRITDVLARRLRAPQEVGGYNIAPGDRIMLVYPPSLDFIAAYLACLKAECVAVPVFPPIPGQLKKDLHHFASIYDSSGAKVALTNTTYKHAKRVVQLREKFNNSKLNWPSDLRWIVTDKDLKKQNKREGKFRDAVALKEPSTFSRESLAFLQYTSGSTSEPKGVMISHGNLAHNLATIVESLGANQQTSCVAWLPQYHDMGLIGSYLGTLYCGGSGFYISPISFVKRPVSWIEMMSRYRATHTQAPNFAYKLAARKFNEMPKNKQPTGLNLSSIQHMFNAAEPITLDAIADFENTFCHFGLPRGAIVPGYGLAEHTVYVCDRGQQRVQVDRKILLEEHRAEILQVSSCRNVSILDTASVNEADGVKNNDELEKNSKASHILIGVGVPSGETGSHCIDVRIVDRETEIEITDSGVVGEIWVNSPSKAKGYFGKDELSKDIFYAKLNSAMPQNNEEAENSESHIDGSTKEAGEEDAPTYLRTGDLGFIYNKELFICGRNKDLIIIRGRNHYPQDIEKTVEDFGGQEIRGGCSAAFSVPLGGFNEGAVGGCSEEVLVVVAEVRDQKKSSDLTTLASRLAKVVAQDHGVAVHKLILVPPRSINKTSSGKIARQWVKKAYLTEKLIVVALSSDTILKNSTNDWHLDEDPPIPENKMPEVNTPNAANDKVSIGKRLKEMTADMAENDLDPADVDMKASIVELGLGSMQVVQLAGQISEEFGVELDDEEMFSEEMTLQKIEGRILRDQSAGSVQSSKVKPMETKRTPAHETVSPKHTRKKRSTLQIVFCFCCKTTKSKANDRNMEDDDF